VIEDGRALAQQNYQVAQALEHRSLEPKLGNGRRGLQAIARENRRAKSFADA
jgi:hypothetical protein